MATADQPQFTGTPVEAARSDEPTGRVHLEDGSTLRFRTVVTEVLRVEGEWDQSGNPKYAVRHQTLVSVQKAPENPRSP